MTANAYKWKIRSAIPADINFIYSTFLKAFKHDSDVGKSVEGSVFFDEYQLVADKILDTADVFVACDPNNDFVIYGYLICEPSILHFAFVKEGFRRLGIAKSLYLAAEHRSGEFESFTHKTHNATRVISKLKLKFNPFKLYQSKKGEQHANK